MESKNEALYMLRYNVRYDVLLQYNTRLRIPRIPYRAT